MRIDFSLHIYTGGSSIIHKRVHWQAACRHQPNKQVRSGIFDSHFSHLDFRWCGIFGPRALIDSLCRQSIGMLTICARPPHRTLPQSGVNEVSIHRFHQEVYVLRLFSETSDVLKMYFTFQIAIHLLND